MESQSVKRTTLSEMAHQAIRRNIITGSLAPGSKLVVASLAKALKLSATPINEALAALEREGLVTNLPHRGYFVWSVTAENIEEIYSIREAFELLAIRKFTKTADPKTVDRLGTLLKQTGQALRANDLTKFSDLDFEFHRVIWSTLNNSLATRIGDLIDGQIRLLVATTARAPGRFRGAFEEHREIFEAIESGDPVRAESTMRKHIRSAKTALERAVIETSRANRISSVPTASRSKPRPGTNQRRTATLSQILRHTKKRD